MFLFEEILRPFMLLGIPYAIVTVAIVAVLAELRFRRRCVTAKGIVVGHRESPDDENLRQSVYRSVVRFTDERGEREFVDSSAYGCKVDPIGQEVCIDFLPNQPAIMRIRRDWYARVYASMIVVGCLMLYLAMTRVL